MPPSKKDNSGMPTKSQLSNSKAVQDLVEEVELKAQNHSPRHQLAEESMYTRKKSVHPLIDPQKDIPSQLQEAPLQQALGPKIITRGSNRNPPHIGSILLMMDSLTQVPNLINDTIQQDSPLCHMLGSSHLSRLIYSLQPPTGMNLSKK